MYWQSTESFMHFIKTNAMAYDMFILSSRPCLKINTDFPCLGISITKIRRSQDRLIFLMGVPKRWDNICTFKQSQWCLKQCTHIMTQTKAAMWTILISSNNSFCWPFATERLWRTVFRFELWRLCRIPHNPTDIFEYYPILCENVLPKSLTSEQFWCKYLIVHRSQCANSPRPRHAY